MEIKKSVLAFMSLIFIAYGSDFEGEFDPVKLQGGKILQDTFLRGQGQNIVLFYGNPCLLNFNNWAPESSIVSTFCSVNSLSVAALKKSSLKQKSIIVIPSFFEISLSLIKDLEEIQNFLEEKDSVLVVEGLPNGENNKGIYKDISARPAFLERLIISVPVHIVGENDQESVLEVFPGAPYDSLPIKPGKALWDYPLALQGRVLGIVVYPHQESSMDMAGYLALAWQQYKKEGSVLLNYILEQGYHPEWSWPLKIVNVLELIK